MYKYHPLLSLPDRLFPRSVLVERYLTHITALGNTGGPRVETLSPHPRCTEGLGEEYDNGVYAVKGECVFYCAAAGDVWGGGTGRWGGE